MPYLVGIDEAGYGPNLGPFVQTAASCWAPDTTCLWKRLRKVVCRANVEPRKRLVFDDSKKVYAAVDGLSQLERGSLAVLNGQAASTIGGLLANVGIASSATEIAAEPWFQPEQPLPAFLPQEQLAESVERIGIDCQKQNVRWCAIRCLATPAKRMNELLADFDSKGAVAIRGVAALLAEIVAAIPADDEVAITVDKQGGRNFYAAMIQSAFPDGWVIVQHESADESRYRVDGLDRPITLCFRPRAESASMPVALASMFSKYLREVFMHQFNQFWLTQVPGLEPTAGYPGDAARFMDAIRSKAAELGMGESSIWRKR